MDFNLSKEELLVQQMYRSFAENEVKPLAQEVDEEERFPAETVKKMAKLGMMGIYFPKEYGGQGASYLSYVMAVEEMSKVCGTTGVILSAHTSLCANPIYDFGTEAQKQKYLPKLCSGEWLGAFGLTEPGAGTDAGGVKTMAVLDEKGENYILNGSKIFITNAGYADVFIIIAMTDKSRGQRGLSAFIVERTFPGFSVGALDETVKYTKERKQFGKSIFKQQNTQFQLADLVARTDAAKWLVYNAAMTKQAGQNYAVAAAKAKLFAAETAMAVTTKAVQFFGGYGYTRDYPVERMMRDAKITEIYEGTSEVQRMVIAGSL